jgi:signal transduction histidine kinase
MSPLSKDRLPSDWKVLLLALISTIVIGAVDFHFGWEVSLFFFYALPIFLVGYRASRNLAALFALTCAGFWWLGNRQSHPYRSDLAFLWVTFTRAIYMLVVAYSAGLLQQLRVTDRARRDALEREGELRKEMLREIEEQQRYVGRELHDGVCQLLSGTALAAELLANRLDARHAVEAADARQLEGYVRKALLEARQLSHGLFPVQMDIEGLPTALEELASTTSRMTNNVRVTFMQNGLTVPMSPEVGMHLYRIAQEAMTNAIKHSGGKRIEIILTVSEESLALEVADDGLWINPDSDKDNGLGLKTMSYRAQQIGARLDIISNPLDGTRVICLLSGAHAPISPESSSAT